MDTLFEVSPDHITKANLEATRAIIQSTSDWIWEIDAQGRYTYCSEKIEKILGYTVNEILGKSPFDLMPPDELEHMLDVFREIVEKKLPIVDLENWNLHKDGHRVCLLTNGIPMFNDLGNLKGFIGADKDITERKLAEEVLKISENKYRHLVETSNDLVWISNLEGVYTFCNNAIFVLLGYSIDEFIGASTFDLIHPDYIDPIKTMLENCIGKKEGWRNVVVEWLHKDGSYRYFESTANPLFNSNGVLIGYSGIDRDITDRRQIEQDLIKTKERAEESDRLKSSFLANMSHEIRTPLNGILGFSELLKIPNLNGEDQLKYISLIEKSGIRMLNTINDIIDISKIEAKQVVVFRTQTNINNKLETIFEFFRRTAERKGLQFLYNTTPTEQEYIINTDKDKLITILTNLINNAIKFTQNGSVEYGYTRKNNQLEFYIKDTGIGIHQKHQDIIYQHFRQVEEGISRGYEGSGLGLSITKAFVELLGGTIWFESEFGEGTTFFFTIPIDDVMTNNDKMALDNSGNDNNPALRKLKVLIAEDDSSSATYLAFILKPLSKETLIAKTGAEAVKIFQENPGIDLILMDIQLADMNGYDVTRLIRKENKDVIIIAQTAYALSGDREKSIKAGCNDYIPKPIESRILKSMIQKHCI
ncbi:MAG: PAS domain S-box protein [Bacteroidota bacterium]